MNVEQIIKDSIKEINENNEYEVKNSVKSIINTIVERQKTIEKLLEEIEDLKKSLKTISSKTISDSILD